MVIRSNLWTEIRPERKIGTKGWKRMGRRETADLAKFFAPSSVALVGATDDVSRFGGKCLQRMTGFGYRGVIYPINPRLESVQGVKCYPTLAALPDTPDHVGVVVPADKVLGILKDCVARGARFATVFTGGFAESGTADGQAMQREITALARDTGLRVMGPNCNGVINFVDGFAMTTTGTIAGPRKAAGKIGIASQSGGVGQVTTMWRAQEAGLGISYEVSCGNSSDLDIIDFASFMVDDDATDIVLMVAEHIPDGGRFIDLAKHAALKEKPIVILKLGRTEAGGRAAASHTGAVTGADDVHDAAFRQFGVIRVEDCNELYEAASMLQSRRWPRGMRAAATTISGGNSVLLVDLGASHGLTWPDYTEATKARLTQVLPKLGSTANPTDVTNAAIGKPDIFRQCIEAIAADDNVDMVVPIFTMATKSDLDQAVDVAHCSEKPIAVLWTGGCSDPSVTPATLMAQGVPVFRNTLACVKALKAAAGYGAFLNTLSAQRVMERPADIAAVNGTLTKIERSGLPLTERASKAILAAYGLLVTREQLATSREDALRIARDIAAPVAVKIESADIPHKTEAKAIRLSLTGDAVGSAFDEVMAAARRYKPDARLDGVLVQEMATPGQEMMLGVLSDPVFGPVVVAALGGIHVEVLRDVSYRIAPIDVADAHAMLQELRAFPLLQGIRGRPPCDIDALCDAIVRLSWLAYDGRDLIAELDINPIIVGPQGQGARIADALIVPMKGA